GEVTWSTCGRSSSRSISSSIASSYFASSTESPSSATTITEAETPAASGKVDFIESRAVCASEPGRVKSSSKSLEKAATPAPTSARMRSDAAMNRHGVRYARRPRAQRKVDTRSEENTAELQER